MNYFGNPEETDAENLMEKEPYVSVGKKREGSTNICGCGEPVRYEVRKGIFACNKHNRCPVDSEKHKFYISFAMIDAKDSRIISMFGEEFDSYGIPDGLNNFKVREKAVVDYLYLIKMAQERIRKQILLEMVPPNKDIKATEKEREDAELSLPDEFNGIWDC